MFNIAGSDLLVLHRRGIQTAPIPFSGRFQVDHGLAAREALVAERGVAPAHLWLIDDFLATGELEVIFPEWSLASVPMSMLITPKRSAIARVWLLIEYLAEHVAAISGVEKRSRGWCEKRSRQKAYDALGFPSRSRRDPLEIATI